MLYLYEISYKEVNSMRKTLKTVNIVLMAVLLVVAAVIAASGIIGIYKVNGVYSYAGSETFVRAADDEDHSGETVVSVQYATDDGKYEMTVQYPYEEWENLPEENGIIGYIYENEAGDYVAFKDQASGDDISKAIRNKNADNENTKFAIAIAIALAGAGFGVIGFFYDSFTAYEKIWFISIIVLASVFSIIFPEENANGVNGIYIMILYLADTALNVLCELLISKQSKWNFIVSVFVEITEILICIVLAYRFATLAATLFFWLPIDIISFINWNRHPDKSETELTKVRTLKGWQEALVIAAIALWTVGIGYLLTTLDIGGDFIKDPTIETVICYIDACVSAVGIANGVFILLRLREQWVAWFVSAILESVINILSGQYVLLVLKLGYITNTTYGFIKWSKYIKSHKDESDVTIL